ncbi:hypothetical protein NLI96_g9138 [Meripilus lineatus]|uniref:Retinal short-chain dehydrogenase/reductase n=1 Tax=Meripilus lineatus TaxID=2056292 RepID=A0AAD5V0Q4_9APHY|nr:hypothetical protein NLI96_g9138 [Physisporinus lineatus]
MAQPSYEVGPVFDSFDLDLVVKVLSHTAFSPFFTSFIPTFYFFQGARWPDRVLVLSVAYCILVSAFSVIRVREWYSLLYRNQGKLLYAPPALDWGEQLVVVTGGSSGVGELIANTLAVRNVNVVVLDINPIRTENYNITYYKCDVSKWEEVEAVSKRIVEELGDPTILINNAGVVQGKLLVDLKPEDVQQTFGVNTLAHFWTLKAFLPEMIKKNSGHIVSPAVSAPHLRESHSLPQVNVASVAGIVGMARMTDYNASKAAVISLHESLRYELDHKYHAPSVRTTLMVPGHIMTPLFSTVRLSQSWLFKFLVPSLAPITVAKHIIAALDDQHSQVIYAPFYVNFTPLLRLMPSFARDFAQWVSGADNGMDDFVKVSGRREEEGEAPEKEQSNLPSFDEGSELIWFGTDHVAISAFGPDSAAVHVPEHIPFVFRQPLTVVFVPANKNVETSGYTIVFVLDTSRLVSYKQPRGNIGRLYEYPGTSIDDIEAAERAEGAHLNSIETLPLWIGAVLAGTQADLNHMAMNCASLAFIASRVLYNRIYMNQKTDKQAGWRYIDSYGYVPVSSAQNKVVEAREVGIGVRRALWLFSIRLF